MGWLLDRIVLKTTRHRIDEQADRRFFVTGPDHAQAFQWNFAAVDSSDRSQLQIVKFIGAAGRAENATPHPMELWDDQDAIMTVVNPPGYGNSRGPARLETLVDLGQRTVEEVCDPNLPIILSGISLGGAVAIAVAARLQATAWRPNGLLLRDPPHLPCVIWSRFGWKSGWLPAAWMKSRVPESLDILHAATKCDVPAVFVSSRRDRIVPACCQDKIVARYAGEKQIVQLAECGHYDPIPSSKVPEYHAALHWLREKINARPSA